MTLALLLAITFVPEAALNAGATPAAIEALQQITAVRWDERNGCLPPNETDIDAESAGMKQFPELAHYLAPSKTIVAGRVETITSGWDTAVRRPATLVSLRVTDALRGASDGERVTFEIDGGRIVVAGRRALCSEPHTPVPHPGDAMLIAGRRDGELPSHIVTAGDTIFRVEGQTVVVPSMLNLAGDRRVSLSSLHQRLRGKQ